jgi:hypothetical protein
MIQKAAYFTRMASKVFDKKTCPFCHGIEYEVIEKKYLVTSLLKCRNCHLNFKHPRDTELFFTKHYQSDYKTVHSYMSDLPSEEVLIGLLKDNFPENRSYKKYFSSLQVDMAEIENTKILEYGASWGYNIHKLRKEGFDPCGYELSIPRADFGCKRLGLQLVHRESDLRSENHIFFSNHVIEHLTDINKFISLARSKLTCNGYFIAFCPNGAKSYKVREPDIYRLTWGFEHPNLLDHEFAAHVFRRNPYLILTGDWDFDESLIKNWDGISQIIGSRTDGKELLIISRPNIDV